MEYACRSRKWKKAKSNSGGGAEDSPARSGEGNQALTEANCRSVTRAARRETRARAKFREYRLAKKSGEESSGLLCARRRPSARSVDATIRVVDRSRGC